MSPISSLLLVTAAATAGFHMLIPDHWLPFVLVGRARGWSARTAALVSGLSALVHVLLSAALGWVAIRGGAIAATAIGHRLERASGALLVLFGLAYAAWAWRKGGHFHPGGSLLHRHDARSACDGHEGPAHPEHLHYHADEAWIRAGKGAVPLAFAVGLNPCVLVLPIMVATAEKGPATVAAATLAYSATTVVFMVGLSVAGTVGARRLPVPAAARYMEAGSGVLIAVVGAAVLLLDH